jgi:hypothetical protein
MKTMSIFVLSSLITVSYVLASGGTETEGLGLMSSLFVGFGTLIVVYQLIPGLMLICRHLKEIFSTIDEKATDARSK